MIVIIKSDETYVKKIPLNFAYTCLARAQSWYALEEHETSSYRMLTRYYFFLQDGEDENSIYAMTQVKIITVLFMFLAYLVIL